MKSYLGEGGAAATVEEKVLGTENTFKKILRVEKEWVMFGGLKGV